MGITVTVDKTEPAEGEVVRFTGSAVPVEDILVDAYLPDGSLVYMGTIYLKKLGVDSFTVIPSRLGPVTVWKSRGFDTGAVAPDITITVSEPAAWHSLIIRNEPAGTAALGPEPGEYLHKEGSDVTVIADPKRDVKWIHWTLDGEVYSTHQSVTVRMDMDHTLVAVCEAAPPERTTASVFLTVLDAPEPHNPLAGVKGVLADVEKTTDASGKAEWLELEPKDYALFLELEGYKSETVTVYAHYPVDVDYTHYLNRIIEPAVDILGGLANIGNMFMGFFTKMGSSTGPQAATAEGEGAGKTKAAADALFGGASPMTPAEAARRADDYVLKANLGYLGAAGALTAVEALSLGQVDVSLGFFLQTPLWRSWMETAVSLSRARDEASLIPLVKQHYLSDFTPNIPGYADMIAVYVKEGYQEEKWVEIPPEFEANMKLLGYSTEWTRRLWGKHWVLPAVRDLYEMYHRRRIDKDRLRLMLKYWDYEPEWRDHYEAISWELPGMIRTRWAFEFGYISREEMLELWINRGLDPKYADMITDAEITNIFREEIGSLRTEYIKRFTDGWDSEDQLRANLDELPMHPEDREFRIAFAKLKMDREEKEDLRTAVLTAFRKRVETETWLREQLTKTGVQPWKMNALVKIEMAKRKLEVTE